jgi:hypothetical protein
LSSVGETAARELVDDEVVTKGSKRRAEVRVFRVDELAAGG